MDNVHSQTVSLIWNIADDVLRDVFVRGQYRDVILPMVVLRRLDALLEPSKEKVDAQVEQDKRDGLELDEYIINDLTGLSYYNVSRWTLTRLKAQAPDNNELLLNNFTEYLLGFSPNVQDVLNKFEFFNKARKLADRDCLLSLIEKITDPYINLTDKPAKDPNGLPLPAVSNVDMGTIFEELLRRFNEENNEEAGEHFTPRDVIHLLSQVVFDPVIDNLPPMVQIYDPACGSGGMLTEATDYLISRGVPRSSIEIAGTEINPETYAICKSDLIIKSVKPDGIYCGNTITDNHFANRSFGYMITNPPYGKSWKEDKKQIYDSKAKELTDDRFWLTLTNFAGEEEAVDCCPRTSDGQLLFVLEMVDRMKPLDVQPQGTRIASIHNGSSLFTGDAGQAESNIRRYLLENDLVEAIIQLPNNIFYNTGISTYCWILTNNKRENRRGKIQLIDASQAFDKLRKNQGNRNCTIENFRQGIYDVYNFFIECDATAEAPIASKIFPVDEFRYNSVTIERPLRLRAQFTAQAIDDMLFDPKQDELTHWLYGKYGEQVFGDLTANVQDIREYLQDQEIQITDKNFRKLIDPDAWKQRRYLQSTANRIAHEVGYDVFMDYNRFLSLADAAAKKLGIKITASDLDKKICRVMAITDPEAEKVIAKTVKATSKDVTTLTEIFGVDASMLEDYGLFKQSKGYILYESDSDLRDTEKIPVDEDIHEYFLREVRPYAADAWINLPATKIGCEISFNKYFYEPKPLRSLEENEADIIALDSESQGLIRSLLNIV